MATPAWELIDSRTLSSSVSSITFSSIPQGYRDLVLVNKALSLTPTGYGGGVLVRINGDIGTNYYWAYMRALNTSPGTSDGITEFIYAGYQNNNDYTAQSAVQFFDYSATDKHKSILTRIDIAEYFVRAQVNRWADTSAITSITAYEPSHDFAAGSTFYLWGLNRL